MSAIHRAIVEHVAALDVEGKAEEALRCHTIELADPEVVRAYVQDLKGLLEASGIVEQKAFLKSFVEGIEVGESEVTVKYTIPMIPEGPPAETVGVLPFIQNGSPSRIRTKLYQIVCFYAW